MFSSPLALSEVWFDSEYQAYQSLQNQTKKQSTLAFSCSKSLISLIISTAHNQCSQRTPEVALKISTSLVCVVRQIKRGWKRGKCASIIYAKLCKTIKALIGGSLTSFTIGCRQLRQKKRCAGHHPAATIHHFNFPSLNLLSGYKTLTGPACWRTIHQDALQSASSSDDILASASKCLADLIYISGQ